MKHKTSAVSDLWDFCFFIIGAYGATLFEALQNYIATCDTRFFCVVCFGITYAAIKAIKKR